MSKTTDPEHLSILVRRIEAGDRAAEGELVEALGRGVGFVLRRLIRDPELARDLYQETFRVVLVSLRRGGLEDPGKLASFVRGTATNLARNEWRKKSRRGVHDDVEDVALQDSGPDPWQRAVAEEERVWVRQVLSEMSSDRDRQILYRHYLEEDPKDEICRGLQIEESQFALVLFRARKRFQKLMENAERRRNFLRFASSGEVE